MNNCIIFAPEDYMYKNQILKLSNVISFDSPRDYWLYFKKSWINRHNKRCHKTNRDIFSRRKAKIKSGIRSRNRILIRRPLFIYSYKKRTWGSNWIIRWNKWKMVVWSEIENRSKITHTGRIRMTFDQAEYLKLAYCFLTRKRGIIF